MTLPRSYRYLADLVRRLRALPHETEWVEFKENYRRPERVGEYLSALANSAALHGQSHGYPGFLTPIRSTGLRGMLSLCTA